MILNPHLIDEKMESLANCMSATGQIKVIAAHQGTGNARIVYVYFKTSTEFASALEKYLRHGDKREHLKLNFYWWVRGYFNENYELVFMLKTNAFKNSWVTKWIEPLIGRGFSQFWSLRVNRKKINCDLATLEQVILDVTGRPRWQTNEEDANEGHCANKIDEEGFNV
jgi:hypothetical protein